MPNWILEILMVWSIRPRSLHLILLGICAWLFIPLLVQWYWSGVELQGQFLVLEDVLGSKFIRRSEKIGFWFMIGCFFTAYKAYKTDKKRI